MENIKESKGEQVAEKYGLGVLLTTQEVSAYFQVDRATVSQWIKTGQLNHFRVGDVIRFKLEEVKQFIAENTKGE